MTNAKRRIVEELQRAHTVITISIGMRIPTLVRGTSTLDTPGICTCRCSNGRRWDATGS